MEIAIILAGFGGQGALFAGQLLAYAGLDSGKHVTWIPSYGPEMRGGTANCTVIIADEPIGAPIVSNPDIAVVFNLPSFEKYEPLVKSGGVLVVNSAIVHVQSERQDIDAVYVPANTIAENLGSVKMLNMALVGAMLAAQPLLPLAAIEETLKDHLPSSKVHLLESNLQVLREGYESAALTARA